MSLQDGKYELPSTLEPKEDEHSALTVDNMVTDVEPLKSKGVGRSYKREEENFFLTIFYNIDYLSSRQLPALDTLQNNYQNDDYIRIKLSGMSVGVSPNSSPRVQPQYQQEQRAEYFSQGEEERRRFDPIRSSVNNTPLLRRIMHHDPSSQRRHSIANMDLNTRSLHHHHGKYTNTLNLTFHIKKKKTPIFLFKEPHIYHHQPPPQQQQSFPGHYSAPSSPPLQHSHQKLNKHPLIPFSPYNNGRPKSMMVEDDLPPPPMRRNSSALVYRNNNTRDHLVSSRRMSSSSSSTSSLVKKKYIN